MAQGQDIISSIIQEEEIMLGQNLQEFMKVLTLKVLPWLIIPIHSSLLTSTQGNLKRIIINK
jgi:hypothetical protein